MYKVVDHSVVLIGEVYRQSIEAGFEGYTAFVSKSDKIDYYIQRIGAS
ncbi:hypothetical protein [Paenibacillus campi]|nr:hypothetical protein [Paenibacillus sp. SGZ-1014]